MGKNPRVWFILLGRQAAECDSGHMSSAAQASTPARSIHSVAVLALVLDW